MIAADSRSGEKPTMTATGAAQIPPVAAMPVPATVVPGQRFASLTGMLAPRSVAVLGASADAARIGGRPIDYMLRQGFAGAIYPVNPRRDEVQGLRAYPNVAALPETPDVAVVAVSADIAVQAVQDLADAGVKNTIVLTAGFAEVDAKGAAEQARMVAIARNAGMRLLGPNCLGLFNARIGFYPTFSAAFQSGWPSPGRIGVASQSGAYGTHLFAAMRNRGIGTQLVVTTGNEADVTIGDVIGWLAEDPETDVIAAYAEGIREADSLYAALAAARAARKPVVMMKVGRSALGTAAAQSHTASIAGDDAVTEAVMAEFGVVRARSTEEMLDIAYAATRRGRPVVLDTSGAALKAALGHSLALIKPSLHEFQHLLGRTLPDAASQDEAARALVASGGAERVAVSLGDQGALLATREGVWRMAALPVRVRGAVGAGDSFVAAMVLALARGAPPREALAWGMAAGAAAVTSTGTAHPTRATIEELFRLAMAG